MATKTELLRELFIANGLDKDEDTWELPMGKRPTIITRTGIEKIQFHNNIKVTYVLESTDPEFLIIKAIAKKGDEYMESYGEASKANTKQIYPVAMAEKRALSRVILKIVGLYKYGVFGEDEAEEFKRENK
jgi:hypothetical protein|tara:strand:- start:356 stop:748 length:393 start_codon:yes stop_codon:yes gene_type:complete